MIRNEENWLNQSGLNLIRIVIGSYFAAVSLDLVTGVNQAAVFLPFLPATIADLVGSTLLFVASIAFMAGVSLRHTSLFLALFVFSSSIIQNFILVSVEDISAFWRDLTLVCAVILNYSNMNPRELRGADLIRRQRLLQARKIRMPDTNVAPRRVSPASVAKPSATKPGAVKPNATKTANPAPASQQVKLPSFMKPPAKRTGKRDGTNINLFARA